MFKDSAFVGELQEDAKNILELITTGKNIMKIFTKSSLPVSLLSSLNILKVTAVYIKYLFVCYNL